jgi:hypothetical protein
VKEDRADLERLVEVAVAALDDRLVLVEARYLAGCQVPVDAGRQRLDAVGACGVLNRLGGCAPS